MVGTADRRTPGPQPFPQLWAIMDQEAQHSSSTVVDLTRAFPLRRKSARARQRAHASRAQIQAASPTQPAARSSGHANAEDTVRSDFLEFGAQFPARTVVDAGPADHVAGLARVAIDHHNTVSNQWASLSDDDRSQEEIDTFSIPSLIEDESSRTCSSISVEQYRGGWLLPMGPPVCRRPSLYGELALFGPNWREPPPCLNECDQKLLLLDWELLHDEKPQITSKVIQQFEDKARKNIERFEGSTHFELGNGTPSTRTSDPILSCGAYPHFSQPEADDPANDQKAFAPVPDTAGTAETQTARLSLNHTDPDRTHTEQAPVASSPSPHDQRPSRGDNPACSTDIASTASDYEWSTNSINSIGDNCWSRRVSEGRHDRVVYVQHMKAIIEIALRRFALLGVPKHRVCTNRPDESPAEVAAGAAANLGSSASTTQHKPSRVKRQAPSRKREDDEDADEADPRGGKKPKFTNPGEPRTFACPYYKLNPVKHHKCASLTLSRIRDVKQHLVRRHLQPLFCFICGVEVQKQADQAEHMGLQTCTRPSWFSHPEGITPDQRTQLSSRVKKTDSERDQWFSVWTTIFPDLSQPDSPFVCEPHAEAIGLVCRFFRDHVPRVVKEVVSSSTAGQVPPGSEQIVTDLVLDSTHRLVQMFTRRLVAVSPPTAPVLARRDSSSQLSDLPGTSVPDLSSEPTRTISDRSMQPPPSTQVQRLVNDEAGKPAAHVPDFIAGGMPDQFACDLDLGQTALLSGEPGSFNGGFSNEQDSTQSFEDLLAAVETGNEYERAMWTFDGIVEYAETGH